MQIYQIILLNILNLYNVVYQLYLNKAGNTRNKLKREPTEIKKCNLHKDYRMY